MLSPSCLSVVLVLSGLAAAEESAPLQWKFKGGQTFYVTTESKIKQAMTIMGMKVNQNVDQTTVTEYKVQEVSPKQTVLKQTILKMTGGDKLPGVGDVYAKMEGMSFTVTLNAKNEITKFEGYEKLLDKIGGDNAVMKQFLKSVLTEDTFKQSASEAFAALPGKAVPKGETWDHKYKVSMGPMGSLKTDTTYKYVGKEKLDGQEVEKITFTGKVEYSPPKGGGGGGLPFKVTKGMMKAEEFSGTIYYDPAKNRVVRSETKMNLKGSLTMSVAGREAQMDMDMDQTTKTTITDKKPNLK